MLLYDWSFSKSIRAWRSLSNSDRAPEAQRLAVEQERVSAPSQEAPTVCSYWKKQEYFSSFMAKLVLFDAQNHIHSGPRLWQRQATRISAALSSWSLPRIFTAVSSLEARECRCRRLRERLFVLSGDSWHLFDFRRLERLICLPLSGSPGVPVSAGQPAHSPRRGLAPYRVPGDYTATSPVEPVTHTPLKHLPCLELAATKTSGS